jgi:hypothetical protein
LYKDPHLIESDWADDIQYLELAVLLLLEYSASPSTCFWRPWLESLPRHVGNAVTLPLFEIAHRLGDENHPFYSTLSERTRGYQAFLHDLCDRHPLIRPLLADVAKRRFGGDLQQARAAFLWAVSMVDSRSFRGRVAASVSASATSSSASNSDLDQVDGEHAFQMDHIGVDSRTQYMAPFFDLLNHGLGSAQNVTMYFFPPPVAPFVNSERLARRYLNCLAEAGVDISHFGVISSKISNQSNVPVDDHGESPHLSPLDSFRMLRADRDIAEGEELLIDYTSNMSGGTASSSSSSSSSSSTTDSVNEDEIDADLLFGFGFAPKRERESAAKIEARAGMLPQKYLQAAASLSVSSSLDPPIASSSSGNEDSQQSIISVESFESRSIDEGDLTRTSNSVVNPLQALRISVASSSSAPSSPPPNTAASPTTLSSPSSMSSRASRDRRQQVEAAALMGSNLRYTPARSKRHAEIVKSIKKIRAGEATES